MRETIYRKITTILTRFWYLFIVVAGLLTLLCYPRTEKLFHNISTDFIKLLPQHYKSVEVLEAIRDKVKGTSSLAIVFESDDSEKTKEVLKFVEERLLADPEVDSLQYTKPGFAFFDKHKLLFLELEDLTTIKEKIDRRIQKEKLGGLYIDFEEEPEDKDFKFGDMESKYKARYTTSTRSEYVTDEDEKIYSMFIAPTGQDEGLKRFKEFYSHIESVMAGLDLESIAPGIKVYYTGTIKNRIDEYDTLVSDLKIAGLVSGIGIFLLLTIYFRWPFAAVIIFLPLSCGIVYSFAFASLFIGNLNVVTSFLFAVLGGLGVEIGIHMFARYREERLAGKSPEESVFIILYHTGRAAITSGITVAATFLILMINDFKGFSEFGFITGSGILIIYFTYHVVFPPLLIFMEKLHLMKFKVRKENLEARGIDRPFPFSRTVLASTLLLVAVSIYGVTHAGFEYNFAKLKSNIKESAVAKEKQRKTTASVNRPATVLIKNKEEALAIKETVENIKKKDETESGPVIIDRYKSWYDIVQYNQDEKLLEVSEIKRLLSDHTLKLVKGENKEDLDRFKEVLNSTEPIEESEIPDSVRGMFFGEKEKEDEYQISFINAEPNLELDDGRNAIEFAKRVEKIDTPKGTFYSSSDAIVFADVLRTMLKDSPRVVAISFFMVFFIVLLDFRNFKKAALVMSPILFGVIIMFGIMYIFKMKLNFYNMIVIPTVFGTSIDNSIHIYHRFEEFGKHSLMEVLRTSGGSAFMSSLTNIFGFLGLVFANHLGLASIGKLAIVGMMACMFTTLIYFPAMLEWCYGRKQGKN